MFTIQSKVNIERKSNRTGSPAVKRTVWMIVRNADNRVIDVARSKKDAERMVRFMPKV